MADTHFPERCVKCNFSFSSFSGSSIPVFMFCPMCSWERAKPIYSVQAQGSTDESPPKSFPSKIHGINLETNSGAAEKLNTSHPGQDIEKTPSKTATANASTEPEAGLDEPSVHNSSDSHAKESTSNGVSEAEENSAVQKPQKETVELTAYTESNVCEENMKEVITLDHNGPRDTGKHSPQSPVITDNGASIQNHEGRQAEAQNGGHGETSEALEVSSNNQQSCHSDCPPTSESAASLQDKTATIQSPAVSQLEPTKASLNVIFHVMVPLSTWNWNDSSKMTIRFRDPMLSGWNKDGGELHMKK